MSVNKITEVGEGEGRKESAYPLYPLEDALKIAEAVRDLGGARSLVSKALLAKHLKYALTGPSFVQRIASAKSYGMITGWGAYSLTEAAKRYFYPTSSDDAAKACISFLSSPPPFDLLIKRFDGDRLPDNKMIGNVLHQSANVPDTWKDKLASMFVRSAQFAGIIDSSGMLRYSAGMETNSVNKPIEAPAKPKTDDFTSIQPVKSESGDFYDVSFRGENVRVQTPRKLSKPLWELLNQYVQAIRPKEDDGPI